MLIARPDVTVYEEIVISDHDNMLEIRGADGESLADAFEMRLEIDQREIDQAFSEASRASQSFAQRNSKAFSTGYDPLREIGSALYHHLFEGRRRVMFERKVERARRQSQGVRLNFELDKSRFAELPWEILHDDYNFITLSSAIQIARRSPKSKPRPYEPLDHVNVLVVGLDGAGEPLVEQINKIQSEERATSGGTLPMHVKQIAGEAFPRNVNGREYQLMHIIGGPRAVFGRRNSAEFPLRPLQRLLSERRERQQEPRLIILQTANSDGIAHQLAPYGGAIVTIRSNVSQQAKAAFVDALYRSLITEHSVDHAIAAARQEIDLQIPGSREWGVPRYYRPPVGTVPLLQSRPAADTGMRGGGLPETGATAADSSDNSGPIINRSKVSDREHKRLMVRLRIASLNLESLQEQARGYRRAIPEQLREQILKTEQTILQIEAQLNG